MSDSNAPVPAVPSPVDLSDDDFVLPPARPRMAKGTLVLGVLAMLAVGFLGGVLVQKQQGRATTGGATLTGRNRTGTGAAGGFAGFGGAGAGGVTPSGAPGAGAGTGSADSGAGAGSSAGAADAPIAIGSVVSFSGTTLVIKDLGGHTRTLTVGKDTTLTTSVPLSANVLTSGQTVSVLGSTAADGSTTVTSVVKRS